MAPFIQNPAQQPAIAQASPEGFNRRAPAAIASQQNMTEQGVGRLWKAAQATDGDAARLKNINGIGEVKFDRQTAAVAREAYVRWSAEAHKEQGRADAAKKRGDFAEHAKRQQNASAYRAMIRQAYQYAAAAPHEDVVAFMKLLSQIRGAEKGGDAIAHAETSFVLNITDAFRTLNETGSRELAVQKLAEQDFLGNAHAKLAKLGKNAGKFGSVLAGRAYADYRANFEAELAELKKGVDRNTLTPALLPLLSADEAKALDEFISARKNSVSVLGRIVHYSNVVDMLLGGKGDAKAITDSYGRRIGPAFPVSELNERKAIIDTFNSWSDAEKSVYAEKKGLERGNFASDEAYFKAAYDVLLREVGVNTLLNQLWRATGVYPTSGVEFSESMFARAEGNEKLRAMLSDPSFSYLGYQYRDGRQMTRMLVAANLKVVQNHIAKGELIAELSASATRSAADYEALPQAMRDAIAKGGAANENGFMLLYAAELPEAGKLLHGYANIENGANKSGLLNDAMANRRLEAMARPEGADVLEAVKPFRRVHLEYLGEAVSEARGIYLDAVEKAGYTPENAPLTFEQVLVSVLAAQGNWGMKADTPQVSIAGLEQVANNSWSNGAEVKRSGSGNAITPVTALFRTDPQQDYRAIVERQLSVQMQAHGSEGVVLPIVSLPENVSFRNGVFVLADGSKVAELPVYVYANKEARERGISTTEPELEAELFRAKSVGNLELGGYMVRDIFKKDRETGAIGFRPGGKNSGKDKFIAVERVDDHYVIKVTEKGEGLDGDWTLGAIARARSAVKGFALSEAQVPVGFAVSSVSIAQVQSFAISNMGLNETQTSITQDTIVIESTVLATSNDSGFVLQLINNTPGDFSQAQFDAAVELKDGVLQADGSMATDGNKYSAWIAQNRANWDPYLIGSDAAEKDAQFNAIVEGIKGTNTPEEAGSIIAGHTTKTTDINGNVVAAGGLVVLSPGQSLAFTHSIESKVVRVRVPKDFRIGGFIVDGAQIEEEITALNGKVIDESTHTYPIVSYLRDLSEKVVEKLGAEKASVELAGAVGGGDYRIVRFDITGSDGRQHFVYFTHEAGKDELVGGVGLVKNDKVKVTALVGTDFGGELSLRVGKNTWVSATAIEGKGLFFGLQFGQ